MSENILQNLERIATSYTARRKLLMNTNIDLNDELLQEAFSLTNLKTEQELIDFALQELIRIRKKRNLLELSGQIQFAPDYDYKASREDRHVSD